MTGVMNTMVQGQPGLLQGLLEGGVDGHAGKWPSFPIGEKVVARAGRVLPRFALDFDVFLERLGKGPIEIDIPFFAPLPVPQSDVGLLASQVDVPDLEGHDLAYPEASPQSQGH